MTTTNARSAKLKNKLAEMKKILEQCHEDEHVTDHELVQSAYEDFAKLLTRDSGFGNQ